MLDHIGVRVSNYARSKAFYAKVLAPLGGELVAEVTEEQSGSRAFAGFGINGKPAFWISADPIAELSDIHVAFVAPSREAVDAFHRIAIAAGATDNGEPGVRPHYHANYYAAFVLDLDGHNVEAVYQGAPG
ncbi:VOC family protein [Dyella subtropica]|uniref:VOC family protein n=1 Tax=Dyella subtropica TaxID=2992127 RepID=UPI002258C17C|nr:VOC family protein [Dyella subtropica]